MISICSITQETDGVVLFKEDGSSTLHGGSARINRIGTLDGGTVLNHLGFADGDRDIQITTSHLTKAQADKLLEFFEDDAGVICAIDIGVYFGAISSLDVYAMPAKIKIQVQSKMSA